MIYVALAEAVLIGLLVWFAHQERRSHDKAVLDILSSNEIERQTLVDKIQHPEIVPRTRPVDPEKQRELTEAQRKHQLELAKVGAVLREVPNGDE